MRKQGSRNHSRKQCPPACHSWQQVIQSNSLPSPRCHLPKPDKDQPPGITFSVIPNRSTGSDLTDVSDIGGKP